LPGAGRLTAVSPRHRLPSGARQVQVRVHHPQDAPSRPSRPPVHLPSGELT
jgi:hypothetical protein